MVYTKTYIFTCFYSQYLILLTMVPRNTVQRDAGCSRLVGQAGIHLEGDTRHGAFYRWSVKALGAKAYIGRASFRPG